MKTLLRLFVLLIGLVVCLAGAAFLLPDSYHVERSVDIHAPAETVFARVGDLKQWPAWTVWHEKDPEMKTTYSASTTGTGAFQKWDGPQAGKGELTITSYEAPRRLTYDLYFPDWNMRSTGALAIAPGEAGAVRVTWSCDGKIGANPMHRWFGLTFDRMIGGDFESGLRKLKSLSETK